jgi:hypothetical protein
MRRRTASALQNAQAIEFDVIETGLFDSSNRVGAG